MKTAPMIVTSDGIGMSEALAMTEQVGKTCGLDQKSNLHLRLLGEELFGMLRGIAGKIEAEYWIDYSEKNLELHMKSEIRATPQMKEQFLAASTSGKNEAARGFMGKLRVMIAGFLLSAKEAIPNSMVGAAAVLAGSGYDSLSAGGWSMVHYKEELKKHLPEAGDAADAWDELEKSIVANIADDIKVKIVGKTVEIVVIKAF